jgi:hypothetical protein
MIGLKEKVGVLPEVELDNYSSVLSGVARIDVDSSSGTVRVVPTAVESCLAPPLRPGDALPEYCPTEIEYEGRRYILKEPLDCEVYWDEEDGDFLWIECAELGLHSTGYTMEVAIERFSMKFACEYERNNELSSPSNKSGIRLSAELSEYLRRMNAIVLTIINYK